ncbi:MAG: putative transcriptional regulator [Rhodothermales bacterium]|jgi:predicted transcriptional regulator
MTSTNLAETLFGAYRRRILALLLLHSEQSYYVRELARLAEVPPGSLHRELKLLAATGLLIRTPVGNQVRYQANRECPVFAVQIHHRSYNKAQAPTKDLSSYRYFRHIP